MCVCLFTSDDFSAFLYFPKMLLVWRFLNLSELLHNQRFLFENQVSVFFLVSMCLDMNVVVVSFALCLFGTYLAAAMKIIYNLYL